MYLDLINLIDKKILCYDEKINTLSKQLLSYKNVYKKLKPKGKKFKKENVLNLFKEPFLLNELITLTQKSNIILIRVLLKNKAKLEDQNRKTDEALRSFNLSKQIIFSDSFLTSLKQRAKFNPNLMIVYQKVLEIKRNDEKLFKINEEIVLYTCNFIIETYERILNDKESLKDNKNYLKYAKENILSNNKLTVRDIVSITNLITEEELNKDEKDKLLNLLEEYIISFSKTDENKIKKVKEKKEKLDIKYTDAFDEIIDEEETMDDLYYNYYIALKSFSSYSDVLLFLESIKYDCNLKFIIEKIILLLDETNEDKLLKEYLSNKQDKESLMDKKLENEENIILYYGFLQEKNKIYSDILKASIPKEYYNDIMQGLDMIKNGNTKNKVSGIKKIKKVQKLRVNDIRITYKKLFSNIYIILGIFCKKDNKGYDIINKTEKRNKQLIGDEKSIIDATNISIYGMNIYL